MARAKKEIKEREVHEVRHYQADILKRFMSDREYSEFRRQYASNRRSYKYANRADSLEITVPENEKEVLRAYLEDTDTPIRELAEQFNLLRPTRVHQVSARAALRLLYQNPDVLSRLMR